jgi:hypothetical protein
MPVAVGGSAAPSTSAKGVCKGKTCRRVGCYSQCPISTLHPPPSTRAMTYFARRPQQLASPFCLWGPGNVPCITTYYYVVWEGDGGPTMSRVQATGA